MLAALFYCKIMGLFYTQAIHFLPTGPGGFGYGVYPGSTDDIVGRVIALNFLVFLVLFVLYVWYRIYTSPECSRGGARRTGTNSNTDPPGMYLAININDTEF